MTLAQHEIRKKKKRLDLISVRSFALDNTFSMQFFIYKYLEVYTIETSHEIIYNTSHQNFGINLITTS